MTTVAASKQGKLSAVTFQLFVVAKPGNKHPVTDSRSLTGDIRDLQCFDRHKFDCVCFKMF